MTSRAFRSHHLWIVASAAAAALMFAPLSPMAGPAAASPADPVISGAGGGVQGTLDDGVRTTSFNDDWAFQLVNAADIVDPTGEFENASDKDFDDSSWRKLNLPHDWSIELDPTPVGTTADAGYYQGGLGWYRKTFTLPSSLEGKDLSVEFDGVYMDSRVYVNGELVAQHPYGYTGFAVDLTGLVTTDGVTPNVIAVKVQNKLPSSRWYSGSGIYRNTHLVVTDPVHVARWGTFVTTPDLAGTIGAGYVDVRAEVEIENGTGAPVDATIVNRVVDAAGVVVGSGETDLGVDDVGTGTTEIRLSDPHLWSIDDPYLYELRTEVVRDSVTVDSFATRFGVRYFDIDPQEGFSLNGESTKIHGVDLHHDLGALGAAVSRDAIERQLRMMKSMGVNAFRTAHNPPSPEIMELCDELGIVVMVEAFDSWRTPKRTYDYGRFFDEWSTRDIQEMVNANRNSPSVILWSIGNEIPDSTNATVGVPIARQLIADINERDTTRPITIGSDKYRSVPSDSSAEHQIAQLLDGIGLNYNTAKSVDGLHAKYPDKFFYESESSSETSARGIYQDPNLPNTGENYTPGKRLTSSYDNNLASWTMSGEYGLKKDRDREFFMGQFLWTGIDYIGEPTPYSVFPVKGGFWGAVDTALFPKDMYYLFQSQWTAEPMVHVVPMNWTDYAPGEEVEVWAYSNVGEVELFLNGESLGTRRFDSKTTTFGTDYLETTEPTGDDKGYPGSNYASPNGSIGKLHLSWKVPFEPGVLEAVARRDGVEVARDRLQTAGEAAAIAATPEEKVIAADGHSLAFIPVDVVDRDGTLVPSADDLLHFEVEGGTLVGLDNGRQESAENYKGDTFSAFNGRALAIVEAPETAGAITVTVTGRGLTPATTTVYAVDAPSDEMLAVDPVNVRTELGAGGPSLPSTVNVVSANGSQEARAVRWVGVPRVAANGRTGVYSVRGIVDIPRGPGARCCSTTVATVTVYSLGSVETVSTVTTAGVAPALPGQVRLLYNDGVDDLVPVTWEAIDPTRFASPGTFAVRGTVDGVTATASASVRVVAAAPEENIASATSASKPTADASYSGAANAIPAGLLDGVTSSGGWSNFYRKDATALLPAVSAAHPREWVSVDWPTPQTVSGTVRAYFTLDAARQLPAELAVSSWNGSEYVPVSNAEIQWASASNAATVITFDPVATSSLRLDLTSRAPWTSTGFLQIAELEVAGMVLPYGSEAALSALEVNGKAISGFDPAVTEYSVKASSRRRPPVITATASANGTVAVQLPLSLPGVATVVVTSEDGSASTTYTVNLR